MKTTILFRKELASEEELEICKKYFDWGIAENTDIKLDDEGYEFAKKVGRIAADYVNFYVLDIAQKENGDWVLIEVNDGQMSGLSEIDPHELYSNLKKLL